MLANKILNFINGEFVATEKWFENRNPIDNALIGQVAEAGKAEVDAAVNAAKAALNGPWGTMPLAKRVELLEALVAEINNRFDEFLEAECADTGKPKSLASHIDIPRGAANFKVFADMVKNVPSEFFEMATPDGKTCINYGYRSPVGVVGVICPWNLPLLLMTWKVGPALACGNTVVVKPSEDTPRTAALLGEVMNKVGIPKGVYNVVHGFGPNSAGEFLTSHPLVDALTFTGETRTGEAIMKAAANGSRPVSLEMGGKNAAIVFADCDFEAAIEGTLRSAFANCGQVCLGTERVYVERPIFDKFVAAMKIGAEGAEDRRAGRSEHRQHGAAEQQETPAQGALLLRDCRRRGRHRRYRRRCARDAGRTGGRRWVQPTIWTGLPETARVIKEEIFGPCCHIAPFDSEEEVLVKANDNKYGLATAIWTTNISRAHRVAQKMEVGIAWVNSWFLRDLRTPFGGAKQSGIGREGGVHSLEFYTELKNVCIKL
jgi:aminomuconate-semialdehyde/2-hydroxymuconate-6-semialdehyde dehydrogenase